MKTWPFWVDLLIWCLLIMLVWFVVTVVAIQAVAQTPPVPRGLVDPPPKARSPKASATEALAGKSMAVPVGTLVMMTADYAPITNAYWTDLGAFFQVSTDLWNWIQLPTVPYPTNGFTLTNYYTNFDSKLFFRAGWSRTN